MFVLKVDAVLSSKEVTQGQSFFQRTCKGWGFITDCIVEMAVHHLLQAAAFVSTSTSHLKASHNQISYAEESSQAAFPMSNVTLSKEEQEYCQVTTYSYKTGDIPVEKISVVTPETGY